MTIGVYSITFPNGEVYIGKSQNIENRIKAHIADMKANRHHNFMVQSLFNSGMSPEFKILDTCGILDLSNLERKYILKRGTLNRTAYSRHSELLSLENEPLVISAIEYYLGDKSTTIPECAAKFGVKQKTLYNIKSGEHYLYLRDIYQVVWDFIDEPTRYNKNKTNHTIAQVQGAILELSEFRYESKYLSEKWGVGDLAAVIHRNRFSEVEIPSILREGIDFMGKYYDCLSDKNISIIHHSVNWKKYGSSLTQASKNTRIGRGVISAILGNDVKKWQWAKKLRPDLWIPI